MPTLASAAACLWLPFWAVASSGTEATAPEGHRSVMPPTTVSGIPMAVATVNAPGGTEEPRQDTGDLDTGDLHTGALLYLELVVNGISTGRIAPVMYKAGEYYVLRDDLRKVSLPVVDGPNEFVSTAAIPDLSTALDSAGQSLQLTVAPGKRARQVVTIGRHREHQQSKTSLGAMMNYDVYTSRSPQGEAFLSYWSELRGFGRWGNVSSTGISRYSLQSNAGSVGVQRSSPYVRFDTQWSFVDERRMVSYSAGDVVTRSLSSGNSVRMAGFMISRNFRLRPDVIPFPIPVLSGTAAVPTAVDVLVNGTQMARQNLDPGPFTVQGIPAMNGAGTATVITQDALGRRVENTVAFYLANDLLKQGMMDYSVSVGVLRRHYGMRSASYGSPAASGVARYGFNDVITLNAQAEAADGLAQAGAGVDTLLRRWGVLSVAGSLSHAERTGLSGKTGGHSSSIGYRYNSRRFRIQARQGRRSRGYQDLASHQNEFSGLVSLAVGNRTEATGGVTLGRRAGTLSAGYFAFGNHDAANTRVGAITYSRNVFRRATLYLTASRSITGVTDTTVQAQLVFSLGRTGTVVAGVTRDPDGQYRQRVQVTRTAPPRGGIGVSAGYSSQPSDSQAPDGAWKTIDATWRSAATQFRAGVFGQGDRLTSWASATGSFIWMGGHVFTANRIEDSFAVIHTDGHAGVPVMFENQLVGRTGRSGKLLVPWVMSHYPGKYSIDAQGLPLTAEPESVEQRIVVRRKSGAVVRFPIRQQHSLHLQLVGEAGVPLPLGLPVVHHPSGVRTAVGWDGLVYLDGASEGGKLTVSLAAGGTCEVLLLRDAVPAQGGAIRQEICR